MTAFTLRLDDSLAKKLDHICEKRGFSKNGLVKSLIRDFLNKETLPLKEKHSLASLVSVVNLGGNAVHDSEEYFE
ncbi:MAG: ribbon-helix-helix protein, CopG family [bacterium]|nr:ribbon-helix-helix protein, CopG family [bacterium]MBU1917836.1 ribbon-helix-helix protein, CopG family [bacterium]